MLRIIYPVNFPEVSTWKAILLIGFYFFTNDGTWKRENRINPVIIKLTKEGPSINLLTVQNTLNFWFVQPLTEAFHGHEVWTAEPDKI